MTTHNLASRVIAFGYGVLCYAIFFATFLYAIAFIGNFGLERTLDAPVTTPLGLALVINLGLLGLFAVQHSVMARPAFKRLWTRIVPSTVERSTYVLFSSLALILLFWQWRPMGGTLWSVQDPLGAGMIYGLYGLGWVLVLVSTFLINHFDLFGLRQVYLHLRNKEYEHLPFKTPALYRFVRHPLYVGWLVVMWATPIMTTAHLLFALGCTGYILIAIQFEERDLVSFHGRVYEAYKARVPMLIPALRRRLSRNDGSELSAA